jgi:hypothetical protein
MGLKLLKITKLRSDAFFMWAGSGYRYHPGFTRSQMEKPVYRRWQHEGTLYGMTSYSNVSSTLASPGLPGADQLVHRMFRTKNFIIANEASVSSFK